MPQLKLFCKKETDQTLQLGKHIRYAITGVEGKPFSKHEIDLTRQSSITLNFESESNNFYLSVFISQREDGSDKKALARTQNIKKSKKGTYTIPFSTFFTAAWDFLSADDTTIEAINYYYIWIEGHYSSSASSKPSDICKVYSGDSFTVEIAYKNPPFIMDTPKINLNKTEVGKKELANLSWVSQDCGSEYYPTYPIERYEVYKNNEEKPFETRTNCESNTEYTVNVYGNSNNNSLDEYYIKAIGINGASIVSRRVVLTTTWNALLPPFNFEVEDVYQKTSSSDGIYYVGDNSESLAPIKLTWDSVEDAKNNEVLGFKLYKDEIELNNDIQSDTTKYQLSFDNSLIGNYTIATKGSSEDSNFANISIRDIPVPVIQITSIFYKNIVNQDSIITWELSNYNTELFDYEYEIKMGEVDDKWEDIEDSKIITTTEQKWQVGERENDGSFVFYIRAKATCKSNDAYIYSQIFKKTFSYKKLKTLSVQINRCKEVNNKNEEIKTENNIETYGYSRCKLVWEGTGDTYDVRYAITKDDPPQLENVIWNTIASEIRTNSYIIKLDDFIDTDGACFHFQITAKRDKDISNSTICSYKRLKKLTFDSFETNINEKNQELTCNYNFTPDTPEEEKIDINYALIVDGIETSFTEEAKLKEITGIKNKSEIIKEIFNYYNGGNSSIFKALENKIMGSDSSLGYIKPEAIFKIQLSYRNYPENKIEKQTIISFDYSSLITIDKIPNVEFYNIYTSLNGQNKTNSENAYNCNFGDTYGYKFVSKPNWSFGGNSNNSSTNMATLQLIVSKDDNENIITIPKDGNVSLSQIEIAGFIKRTINYRTRVRLLFKDFSFESPESSYKKYQVGIKSWKDQGTLSLTKLAKNKEEEEEEESIKGTINFPPYFCGEEDLTNVSKVFCEIIGTFSTTNGGFQEIACTVLDTNNFEDFQQKDNPTVDFSLKSAHFDDNSLNNIYSIKCQAIFTNTTGKTITKTTIEYSIKTANSTLSLRKNRVGINIDDNFQNDTGDTSKNSALYVSSVSSASNAPVVEIVATGDAQKLVSYKHGESEVGSISVNEKGIIIEGVKKEKKYQILDYIIPANGWKQKINYYYAESSIVHTIEDSRITSDSTQEIIPRVPDSDTLGSKNIENFWKARLIGGKQSPGSCDIVCLGKKPDVPLPITIIFRGE